MVASVEPSFLASIEALNGEELNSIIATFEPEEMAVLMAEMAEARAAEASSRRSSPTPPRPRTRTHP